MQASSIARGIINSLATVASDVRSALGLSVASYCDLETASDTTLIAKDSGCATLLRLAGTHRVIGVDEFEEIVRTLSTKLSANMAKPGHTIQICFGSDRGFNGLEDIRPYFAGRYAAAAKFNLDIDDLLDDTLRALSKHVASEYCYIALWTSPKVINANEWKNVRTRDRAEKKGRAPSSDAQDEARSVAMLVDTHESFVRFFMRDLSQLKLEVEALDSREACNVIRRLIDPEFTAEDWSPILPGDRASIREVEFNAHDFSNVLLPRLEEQLIPRDPEIIDLRTVRIGNRLWAPVVVNQMQRNATPFQDLFGRMRAAQMPWRIMMTISGGGLEETGLNQQLSSALTLAGAINKVISEQYRILKEKSLQQQAIVSMRMVAATWAPLTERPTLITNASRLARALQGWGGCDTSEVTGNPVEGLFSTIPALRRGSVGPATNATLEDALGILPISRPASPWSGGSFLFRTVDGKPYPFTCYSSLQDAWLALIASPPGGGKSVLMNALNLALALDPLNDDLPLIRTMDIGPSSSGFPSLMAAALPESKRHMAQYHRIQNTKEFAWNLFDTPLGQRQPTPAQVTELVSIVCLLATPLDRTAPQDGIDGIAIATIELAYKRMSDGPQGSPRKYAPRVDPFVDEAVTRHGLRLDGETCWWEIVDGLFEKGDIRAAMLAQRYAVPLMQDVASMSNDPSIVDLYKDRTSGGTTIVEYYRRKLLEAISSYAIFSGPTRFDLGDAPIIAINLEDVALQGSASAERQAAIMYMATLRFLSADFMLGKDLIPWFSEKYRAYHEDRILRLERRKKRLCADELHRPAQAAPATIKQIERLVREGRKWQIDIILASQRFEDFSESLISNQTALYILKPPSTGAGKYAESFGLNATEIYNIENKLLGAEPGVGANVFARFITKRGTFSHLLTNTLGAVEVWAFSTTTEDKSVRDALYSRMPPAKARRLLARLYPSGSVKKEIERRQLSRTRSGINDGPSVTDEIIEELIRLADREHREALSS